LGWVCLFYIFQVENPLYILLSTEAITRKEIIDLKLKAAGWDVTDSARVTQEYCIQLDDKAIVQEPIVSYNGLQFCDYVLLGKDGKPLAVIEAKKTAKDAAVGREQAKQYCYNIVKTKGGNLPFCYYTNGHDIFFWDLEHHPPRKVYGYPTRDDLERYLYLRKNRKALAQELINPSIVGRDYQIQAIRSVLEGITKKKRKFLLVMATGTGKTRTCIALVDALMRAGWIERTLFLVDRIGLRDQTIDEFKFHLPNEPRWPKEGEYSISTDRRIYVSTYPTMLNIIRSETNPLSAHFFDLIVVDESHRSIYNTYQEILEYFNAFMLGLTATPTNVIDHNTFKIFECEDGVPTYAYTYDEAVNNIPPYLSNFQVMKIKSKFQQDGINKRTISLEDQMNLIQEGKEVEEINHEGTELEKTVVNKGTNALIVRQFMEECIKDPNGVLPGKTIFFCMSKSHARRIEEIFDSLFPEYGGELAKVLVSEDSRVHGKGGLLDQFKNNDMPRVAISVDMLDTGIDVREIVNLVFAKPVYSYTKFWQMIGRGTRLIEKDKIKPWCPEKDVFLILDCWDNFEYFKLEPKGKELSAQVPLPVRLFGFRLDKIEKALELGRNDIIENEISRLKAQIDMLPKNSVSIMDAASSLAQLAEKNFWIKLEDRKVEFLRATIRPLMRTISDADFKAMRFEKSIVEVSLAHLNKDEKKFEVLKESIIEEIARLPLTINIVAREEELIRKSQTNHFWATISEPAFNSLIDKLAPLVKHIESFVVPLGPAKYDLRDIIVTKEYVEFGPQHEALSVAKYRELVERRIKDLVYENPILQKIKEGKQINPLEAEQLADQLYEDHPHITIDLLRRVYNNKRAELTQFIKHILGIEVLVSFPETVSKAFEEFIATHTDLTSRQLQFLDLLKGFVIERGELTKRDLIQSPFTMLHPEGIRGVFKPREIEEILLFAQRLVA
jgi:type I restriction enzyme, R subunit